jgi:RNA polymerase sigma-70 factor (ECF subfamily)
MEKALMKKTQDKDLIKAFVAGSELCFEELLRRYKAKVFATIYVIVKDRDLAEDLFQDVMVKVVRMIRAGSYNEEGKFMPWISRIARNLAIDYFRKNQRNPIQRESGDFDLFNSLQRSEPAADAAIILGEKERFIRELIQQLPDKQREVLVMRIYADLSFKEIAAITGVSINTALGRMRYALLNLKKMAEDHGFSPGYEENIF